MQRHILKIHADIRHIEVLRNKKEKYKLIAQVAPAVRVALGEPFGGKIVKPKQIVTALKKIGFEYVFDTLFGADLTIVEEGTELIYRLKQGKPLYTSCCPGWIQFIDNAYPDMKEYISTCKSPQQMMGAIVKHYFAYQIQVDPLNIYMVSFMPCVKKQAEADKVGVNLQTGVKDVDLVITTDILAELLKENNIDPSTLEETDFDSPLGEGSGGAAIFGRTGGVMIAALRYAYSVMTNGNSLPEIEWSPLKDICGIKEATITIPGQNITLKVAIIVGLADAKKYINVFKEGKVKHDFIEVMACFPAGCISGGGQPLVGKNKNLIEIRKNALNAFDNGTGSHQNIHIKKLYSEYLGEPMSEQAQNLLHQHDNN